MLILLFGLQAEAKKLLLPMDENQKNHLKAYGIAYWTLERDVDLEWLLNYRGGSFLIPFSQTILNECNIRGVSYEVVSDAQTNSIYTQIASPDVNMEIIKLEKVPKIAVYSPQGKQPWDDAVTLVLTYAEIPYEIIYDTEVIEGKLPLYDWLHLHHEDFTGQFGKFYASYKNAAWYQDEVRVNTETANKLGFSKVSDLKNAVANEIKKYVIGGGFLFTMCSGTDSYDISLAATGVDICESMYDGDPAEANYQSKLDFSQSLAFKNFSLVQDPLKYEFSNIDATMDHVGLGQVKDVFTLFDFSAKWDIVPTMLTQSHKRVVTGFMGQTTAFRKDFLKPNVTVLGETKSINSAKYIHGELGKGQWTFYGGHDPEDYRHLVGDPPTDLNLHPNSAGYRLILNNVLFPAAKKKKLKT
ncbi:asparagine synthetase B [Luteibaculum oceani]|uniref:Asparagine synthetase B n=2 Tax=Luteibaculum oceani TaxID=1294296 RepID=A0A5C6VEJ0_9FLAO|nr:asparagine synthetase B [Luteibaculum oceani]